MTARVRGPMAASNVSGVSRRVVGLTSANRGVAPASTTASAVATNVFAGTTTSSPRPTPSARSVSVRASVPLPTATAHAVEQYAAQARSNRSTSSPPTKTLERTTLATAASTSALTSRVVAARAVKGTVCLVIGSAPWCGSLVRVLGAGAGQPAGEPGAGASGVRCHQVRTLTEAHGTSGHQRALGALQHLDHGEPVEAVRLRSGAGEGALDEVLVFDGQGLLRRDEGNGDVAVAVRRRRLRQVVSVRRAGHALVMDADPLLGRQVVVDGHLLAADHGHPTYLAGVQPTDVDVGLDVQLIIYQSQVCNVLEAVVRVPGGPRLHRTRRA